MTIDVLSMSSGIFFGRFENPLTFSDVKAHLEPAIKEQGKVRTNWNDYNFVYRLNKASITDL